MTFDSSQSESAGSRSLDRLVSNAKRSVHALPWIQNALELRPLQLWGAASLIPSLVPAVFHIELVLK